MQTAVNTVQSFGKMPSFLMNGEPASQIRVVAVGGDDYFRDMLPNELSEQGFAVTTFTDTPSVLAAADPLSAADLIVLDWGLSGNSGLDLLHQLRRLGVTLPIVFITHRSLTSNESLALEHGAVDFIDKSRGISILAQRLRIVARIKVPERPSIFHATHPVPLAVRGCPNIYTIHDLVPLRLPYTTLDNKKYFYRLLTSLARTADHIVTVSEHSRRDIIEFLGIDEGRVTNTYQAVDIPARLLDRTDGEVADDLAKLFGLDFGGYFLFYGAIEPKKNVSRMVDAYAGSGSKLPLIIAGGSGWQNRADLRKIRDERFTNFRIDGNVVRRERQVRRLEFLPHDQLVTLIRGARALLFPSIYEGFGVAVIEAMAVGRPVLNWYAS